MQEKNLFEYAVLRLVPRVEREEFLNIGVVLFCKRKRFLKVLYHLDEARIAAFAPSIDQNELRAYLDSFNAICEGNNSGGPIARLEVAERFRWLTAMRSSVLQTSRVHPGLCFDMDEKLKKLFQDMVL